MWQASPLSSTFRNTIHIWWLGATSVADKHRDNEGIEDVSTFLHFGKPESIAISMTQRGQKYPILASSIRDSPFRT